MASVQSRYSSTSSAGLMGDTLGASTHIWNPFQKDLEQMKARQQAQAAANLPTPLPLVTAKRRWMDELRAYVKEYRDILFTIALVLLLDHLFFEGAMRERLKGLLSGMVHKAESKLGLGAAA